MRFLIVLVLALTLSCSWNTVTQKRYFLVCTNSYDILFKEVADSMSGIKWADVLVENQLYTRCAAFVVPER